MAIRQRELCVVSYFLNVLGRQTDRRRQGRRGDSRGLGRRVGRAGAGWRAGPPDGSRMSLGWRDKSPLSAGGPRGTSVCLPLWPREGNEEGELRPGARPQPGGPDEAAGPRVSCWRHLVHGTVSPPEQLGESLHSRPHGPGVTRPEVTEMNREGRALDPEGPRAECGPSPPRARHSFLCRETGRFFFF